MQGVGVAWFMMSISDAPTLIASLQTAACLPIIFLSFVAGAYADSVDRRVVMLCAQAAMLATTMLLAAAAFTGLSSPWPILGLAAVQGAALAFYGPAAQAALMSLVPRALVASAVGLGSFSYNFSRTFGPALGGLLIAGFGPAPVIALGAIGSIALCIVLAWWKPATTTAHLPREPLLEGIHTGARFIALSPGVVGVLLRTGLFGVCGSVILAFPPLIATDLLEGGPTTLGALLAAFGAGAIASAFTSARLRQMMSPARVALLSGMIVAVSLIIIGANLGFIATLIAFVGAGGAWVAFLTPMTVSIQMHAPRWMAGRAAAAFQIVLAGGLAMGSPIWGALAQQIGVGGALLSAGALLGLLLLHTRNMPIPVGEEQDAQPLFDHAIILPAVNTPVSTGKIVVMVEYRVPETQAVAFRQAAQALGRQRMRDGARRWGLMQNLEDRELWIERFEAANWTEHLRRMLRPTTADKAVRDHVASFSTLPVAPRSYVQHAPNASSPET